MGSVLGLVATIRNAGDLALAAGECAGFHQLELSPYADDLLDGMGEALTEGLQLRYFVAEILFGDFDLDGDLVEVVLAGENDQVVGKGIFDLENRCLDLRREDVDPANDEHVVAAPVDPAYPADGAPAAGWGGENGGDVVGAVAQNRHRLLAEGAENQLTFFSIGKGFAGLGIDNFGEEMVFENVESVLGL